MAEHRRYTKREKAVAVTAALASSVKAAAESQGIPERTLGYWVEHPQFAELRAKTREQIAEGSMVLATLAQRELMRKLQAGEVEPKDLAVIFGIAIDKAQLLSGQATSRHETRDVTESLDDHERAALADAIDEWLAGRTDAAVGEPAIEAGTEVRE